MAAKHEISDMRRVFTLQKNYLVLFNNISHIPRYDGTNSPDWKIDLRQYFVEVNV